MRGETSETFSFKNICNISKVATKVDLFSQYVRKHDAKDSNRVHKKERPQFNKHITRTVSNNFNRLRKYHKKQMSEILLTTTYSQILVCVGKSTSYISLGIANFEYIYKNDNILA